MACVFFFEFSLERVVGRERLWLWFMVCRWVFRPKKRGRKRSTETKRRIVVFEGA
jgi:hypothetical protein